MTEPDLVAEQFEANRARLRAVAYRMLGSTAEADDAVQEAWLRLERSDAGEIRNLGAWLTTVVGRVALDMLRARQARRETLLDEPRVTAWPEPAAGQEGRDPAEQALLADSVGLALMVVLETLSPAERLAFVLHDMFGVPFAEIGPMLDRSADAAKMLASRARRRVRGAEAPPADLAQQRTVVEAFRAASRDGDFEALVAVLHPEVEAVADSDTLRPGAALRARGAEAVARQSLLFRPLARLGRPVLVNGGPGALVARGSTPIALLAFTVRGGLITRIDITTDRERLARLDLSALASAPRRMDG